MFIVNFFKHLLKDVIMNFRSRLVITKIVTKNDNLKLGLNLSIMGYEHIKFGKNCVIGNNNNIHSDKNSYIQIGDYSATNNNVYISSRGGGKIIIGKNVIIAPNVVIRSNNHNFHSLEIPIQKQGISYGEIFIEDDVWIAANCVILPNVKIGKGSIIGGGSVVTKDVDLYSIMGGVPAKKIGSRINDEKTN
jgi:galactoside O-acetyltransferase